METVAEKIIGVMIRAWVQARAMGPLSVKLRDLSAWIAQVSVASGSVARKMIAK